MSALALVAASIYVVIGRKYLRLRWQGSPLPWFGLFWIGIATYATLDAAWAVLVPLADPPLALGVLVLQLKILAATCGFFGLVYYLAYVYSGSRKLFWPLLAFYLLTYALTVYSYAARDPIGQAPGQWGSGLVYANPGGLVTHLAYALQLGPPLLAALAYAALLPRARTREQRMRVLATSGAFVVFFGGLLLGWMTSVVPNWPLVEKCMAVLMGLAVLRFAPRVADGRRGSRVARASMPVSSLGRSDEQGE